MSIARPIWGIGLSTIAAPGTVLDAWFPEVGFDAPDATAAAALIADLRARNRAACVPAWREEAGAYGLAAFRDGDAVAPGPGGIPEPVARRWTDPAAVDLFLLPGLLFDEAGTRLGHGRGHLDRLLAARRPGAAAPGLAFPWQLLRGAAIPAEPHDVPMDAVVLPDGPVYPLKTTNFRSA